MMSDCVEAVDLYLASLKFESRSSHVLVHKKLIGVENLNKEV